ncbi:hypothetical protein ACU4GD_45225 [Cupriavidus basilensis]
MCPAAAPVRRRIGLANATQGSGYEPAARLFYTDSVTVPRQTHLVRRSRLLGSALTGLARREPPRFFGPGARALHVGDPLWRRACRVRYAACFHAPRVRRGSGRLASWHALGRRLADEGLDLLLPWGNDVERRAAEETAAGVLQAQVLPRSPSRRGFGLINARKW